jgi:hypothetical protein
MFHELVSRDRGDGCPTGQPQGVGSEAYLNGTSQGPTPEDARKDAHIIRARYAPLSPASGFPVSRSQSRRGVMKYPGYEKSPRRPIKQPVGAHIDKEVSTLLYVKI